MLKLTKENTVKAIERCRKLKPRVVYLSERKFIVHSSNNKNTYTVEFFVISGEKFGECDCQATVVCYHIIGAATANIYRQSVKLNK